MSPLNFRANLLRRARSASLVVAALFAVSVLMAADPATGSVAPVAMRRVAPEFPSELKKEFMKGMVILECLVGTDGKAEQIHAVEATHPAFSQAAVESLEQWEFTPGTINGQPSPIRIRVPFEFQQSPEQILEEVAGRPVFMEVRETVIPAMQLPSWPRPKPFYIPRYPPELEGTGKNG